MPQEPNILVVTKATIAEAKEKLIEVCMKFNSGDGNAKPGDDLAKGRR
jgi:hypothetical protein